MPQTFNVEAARRDGVSEQEIADFLAQQHGFDIASARRDGVADAEIIGFLSSNIPSAQSSQRPDRSISELIGDRALDVAKGVGDLASLADEPTSIMRGLARNIGVDIGSQNPFSLPGFLELAAAGGDYIAGSAEENQSAARQWNRENAPWYDPDNLIGVGLESAPSMAIPLGGGLAARAVGLSGKAAAGITAVLEGGQGALYSQQGTVERLMADGYTREQAERASALPSLAAGVGTGLIGRAMGGFEAQVLDGLAGNVMGRGVASGLTRGALTEGAEEAAQSGQEQFFSNVAARTLDPSQNLMEGVGTAALQGGVLGGLMGGTIGGTVGGMSQLEAARGRAAGQLFSDLEAEQIAAEARGDRAVQLQAQAEAAAARPKPSSIVGSLTDRSSPSLTVPPTPADIRRGVDQVTWREQVAPILDQMAQGNYQQLLNEQAQRQEEIARARKNKKRLPAPYPDPVPPARESQLSPDPFTPEMGAELIRSAEAGPVTPSMLKEKGIPKPKETLSILERRGFLKKTGEQKTQVKAKNGKTLTRSEPVYESTALKEPERPRPGETAELTIRPIPVQQQAGQGAEKTPSPQAIAERTAAARERVSDLRRQLVSLPQVGEDWTQSRIDALDSRRKAIEAQLEQAEFDAARAETGRASWAVVERISGPRLDGRQDLDFVADPSGAPRENVIHTFPTKAEAEKWIAAKKGETEPASAPKDPKLRENTVIDRKLQAIANHLVGPGVKLDVKGHLFFEDGTGAIATPEGSAETSARDEQGKASEVLIQLARDTLDPELSLDERLAKMAEVLNHEAVHALRTLGKLTPEDWRVLTKEARTRKMEGKEYTYLQMAFQKYRELPQYQNADGTPNMDLILEEAVAEMYREFAAGDGKVRARYQGVLNKIKAFLRELLKRVNDAQEIMAGITSGDVGQREIRGQDGAVQVTEDEANKAGPPGVPPDRRFMFAGKKSKIPPEQNFKNFQQMVREGEDQAKIYYETGWYTGMDGMPRYEISDEDAKLTTAIDDILENQLNGAIAEYKFVEEVLDHPELLAAYPVLRKMVVEFKKPSAGGDAYSGRAAINDDIGRSQIQIVTGRSTDKMLDTLLHEVQHIIQADEGWSNGGSKEAIGLIRQYGTNEQIRRATASVIKRMEMEAERGGPFGLFEWIGRSMGVKDPKVAMSEQLDPTYVEEFTAGFIDRDELPDEYREMLDKDLYMYVDKILYHHMGGEIEARNTSTRRSESARDRRRKAPWRTTDADVRRGIQIAYPVYVNAYAKALNKKEMSAWASDDDRRFSISGSGVWERNADGKLVKVNKPAPGATPWLTPSGGGMKEATQVAQRYTVLQDYLSGGARTNAWVRDKLDDFTTKMQDRMHPVRRMVTDVLRYGGQISDDMDPILADELYTRRAQHRLEKAHGNLYRPAFVAVQQINATKSELEGLAKVSGAAAAELLVADVHPSLALLNVYLYARHAKERNKFIKEVRQKEVRDEDGNPTGEILESGSGMSDTEADAVLNWFARYPKQGKVEAAARKVDAIIDYTRHIRVNSGLSPDWNTVDSPLVPRFDHYVPLRGEAADTLVEDWMDDSQHARTGKSYELGGREDPRMTGRRSYAGNILTSVIIQNEESIVRSEKARIGQALAKFVRANKDLTKNFIEELPAPPTHAVVDSRTGKVRMSPVQNLRNNPRYYVTKENGKEVIFEVKDPKVGRALSHVQSFDDGPSGWILSRVTRLTRLMSQLQTSFNPDFTVPNLLRDVQAAMIQSREFDKDAAIDIGKRAMNYARQAVAGKLGFDNPALQAKMEELSAEGGLTGVYGLRSLSDQLNEINRELAELDPVKDTGVKRAARLSAKGVAAGFKYLEDLNDAVEGATRLAVYEAFRDRGYSQARAAQMAKNMTVNFNKKGEWGSWFNAAYMFFNAATQGSFGLLKASTHPRVQKVIAGIMIAGFLQELLASAMSPEDEYGVKEYDKIEDYLLEKNIVIPIGDGNYAKIPLPLGYNIFHNAGRNLARVLSGKEEPLEAMSSMLNVARDAFNPFGSNANWITAASPSIIKPLVEAGVNRDFTGSPIHPDSIPGQDRPASQEFFPSVSELSEKTADFLSKISGGDGAWTPGKIEVHPDTLDHLSGAYFGGAGRFIGRVAKLMGYGLNPEASQARGTEIAARDIPVYRAFAGNVSGASIRTAYDQSITPYLQFGKSFDEFEKEGNFAAMDAMVQRNGERLAVYDFVKNMERDRINLRRQIREIQTNPHMEDESKARIVKQLTEEEQGLMNMTLRDLKGLEDQLGL